MFNIVNIKLVSILISLIRMLGGMWLVCPLAQKFVKHYREKLHPIVTSFFSIKNVNIKQAYHAVSRLKNSFSQDVYCFNKLATA